ncbi:glycosyltransferase [Calothrix sp. NIES-3974]|uniref:glycosyltransferase n=1 Tax=Calothrix sp. NIES-3974 TaxID=2005462 RepID=UPI000B5DC663|nr:glycosyltransferase [Calothrix sp. NIES-3974]BAZ07217.1 putative glycosyltransferase [Calothrix sp. NIES-3974]
MINHQSEEEQLRQQLRTIQLELEQTKTQLQSTQADLANCQGVVAWMETSKFWKARLKFINLRQKFKQKLQTLIPRQTSPVSPASPVDQPGESYSPSPLNIPRFVPSKPNVLLVVEETLPQCMRYRVQQKLEQLQSLDYQVNWVSWRDRRKAEFLLHFCHVVIFYRVPAFPDVVHTIKYAKSLHKVVFFDIDDLIFCRDAYPEPYENLKSQLSLEDYEGLIKGVKLYREALSLCDYAIASTPTLAREMEKVTGNGTSFCHRNALDRRVLDFLRSSPPKLQRDYLSIFYGSGTKTHDADFQVIAPAIAQIMEKYSQVRLTIVGYLTLPKELDSFADRIDRVPLLTNLEVYWEFLSQADINIAPLKMSLFNDCKSEIKWLEAAIFGVPSIVSPTQMYLETLENGVDVMMAQTAEEWLEKLDKLVGDREIRAKIAHSAKQKAMSDYAPETMADNLQTIITTGIEKAISQGKITRNQSKPKLLFVNVLYPPQSLGGATGLLKNIIDHLQTEYSDRYSISVFTYDIQNPNGYELYEYNQDGIHVTRLSLPPYPGIDWNYQDQRVYEIFRQYLEFNQPDLIHFHCVQRLTASILEASVDLNIPYFVTVHDAWWICDHQFMLDSNGLERNYHQNDPLILARYADDINSSMQRLRYLAKYLNKAKLILAVSEFQAELYRLNGFTQIQVNRNGIKPIPVLPRKPSLRNKLRLGYAGGICVHKGYYFLKEAITSANLHNTELTVIDFFISSDEVRHETWGTTRVTFIPKIESEKMPEFFSNIDVLIAPSLWPESFGLITREATLAGVWVVASNKGGLAEDIITGVNGNIFDPEDINDLVNILQSLDQDIHKYQQQLTLTSHQIRKISEQVEELVGLYDSVLV